MAHLIDKDALVAEIERRTDELWAMIPDGEKVIGDKHTKEDAFNLGKYTALESFGKFIDTLEVKEADLKDCDAMNGKIDDSDISCNCTSCSVHTTCKYFNHEKESNVKHCFGGVPMQLKQRKESAVKEVDLDFSRFSDEMLKVASLPSSVTKNTEENPLNWEYAIAKHFFELGLKARQG